MSVPLGELRQPLHDGQILVGKNLRPESALGAAIVRKLLPAPIFSGEQPVG